jgi:hypothetical protein
MLEARGARAVGVRVHDLRRFERAAPVSTTHRSAAVGKSQPEPFFDAVSWVASVFRRRRPHRPAVAQ